LNQSTSLPTHATTTATATATAQVTFLFTYHPVLDLVLVQVPSLSISSFQKGNSFPFKKIDFAHCVLPSHLRKSTYFTGTLESGLGKPEMWAQWIAGLRPLPPPNSEGSLLSTASLVCLVSCSRDSFGSFPHRSPPLSSLSSLLSLSLSCCRFDQDYDL
jgi:hypothetical protein